MKKILVISSADSKENVEIVKNFIEKLNDVSEGMYLCTNVAYSDIAIFLSSTKKEATILSSGQRISEFDFVYFKSYIRHTEEAAAIVTLLQYLGIPFICSEIKSNLSISKISQYAKLSVNDVPLPKTVIMDVGHERAFDFLESKLGVPFVCKAAEGKGGEANFIVKDKNDLDEIYNQNRKIQFVCQSFIPNDGDVRVLVFGNKVRLVIGRKRKDDSTHLNNTSQGGSAVILSEAQLGKGAIEISIYAAKVLQREIAGVDIMFDSENGKTYVLEVNASPQIGSGAFTEEKVKVFKEFILENYINI